MKCTETLNYGGTSLTATFFTTQQAIKTLHYGGEFSLFSNPIKHLTQY